MQRGKRKAGKSSTSQANPAVEPTLATFEIKAARETRISFSGPLPPPEIMQAYNTVIPNGAERILAMAENQSVHRQEIEKIVVRGNSRHQTWGILAAFLLSIVIVCVGAFLIYNDKDIYGLTVILGDLAALAGVFVYARRSQQQERTEKSKPFKSG